ncbi:MAG TPA: PLD nuclease N-terminal domain-containing protein [Acidimicrobiia bacterium]|nr:PLD nuclease N-terminal domain-containing protein [Acidimicrobiia bacterium]
MKTYKYALSLAAASMTLAACSPFPKALRPNTYSGFFGLIHLIVIIWAVVDIVGSQGKSTGTKVLWILVVAFAPLIGLIFYIMAGREK